MQETPKIIGGGRSRMRTGLMSQFADQRGFTGNFRRNRTLFVTYERNFLMIKEGNCQIP